MEKKKIMMIGPGRGHNILPIIEEFNKQDLFQVDFLCHYLEFRREDYININFIPFPKWERTFYSRIRSILFHLRYGLFGGKYDILLIHGEVGIFLLFLLTFIKAKIKIYTPWSYGIIDKCKLQSKEGKISRLIFNWFEEKEAIERIFPKSKIILFFWGLHDSFFTPLSNQIESNFVKEFLASIPDRKVIAFWPRSICRYHGHNLVVEALGLIKREFPLLLRDFVLFFWHGNGEDKLLRTNIEKLILNYDLSDNIKIIDHPFVAYGDIRIIENRSDFFINISYQDGVSTFIHEMLLQEKDIILSNISTYKYLNDYFKLKLDLVEIDVESIAAAIKNKLLKIMNQDTEILAHRKRICEENFRFTKNYPKFIDFIYSLSKK